MKHFKVGMVLFLLSCAWVWAQGVQTYQQAEFKIQLQYPSDWVVQTEEPAADNLYTVIGPSAAPASDETAVEIVVVKQVAKSLEQVITDVLDNVSGQFTNFQELGRRDALVAGLAAKIVTIQVTDQQQNLIQMDLAFFLQGQQGYVIFLESFVSKLPVYQPILNQILASVNVSGQAGLPLPTPTPSNGPGPLSPPATTPGSTTPTPLPSAPLPKKPGASTSGPATPTPSAPVGQTPAGGDESGVYGELSLGVPKDGVLAAAPEGKVVYHTYTVTVPAGLASLTVSVSGQGSDVDLAVKMGSEITSYAEDTKDCDFCDFSEEQNPQYVLSQPPAGTLYIDVVNALQNVAAYQIVVTPSQGAVPQTNNPLGTSSSPAANPLAVQDPMVGKFSGDGLTLELAGQAGVYTGTLLFGANSFPVSAQQSGQGLQGTFTSNGSSFAFSATLQSSTLTFVTDGTTYTLQKQ